MGALMNNNSLVMCAGIIVVDHLAAPIDHLPKAGELVLTDDCFLAIGGCASNVAIDLRKQGIETLVVGCVGDDLFARFARETLEGHGADCRHVKGIERTATSQTLIVNVLGQDRRFIHHIGANGAFTDEHFPLDRLAECKILYVGGLFLLSALTGKMLGRVLENARRRGVITVLDVVTPGPRDYETDLRAVLPYVDYFLPNHDESVLMTSLEDPFEQAERFREWGAATAVITQGGEGAVVVSDGDRFRASAFESRFVDGTGGGDAFSAGFIRGLLENAPLVQCVTYGSALGASCVSHSGATTGVLDRGSLDQFVARHKIVVSRRE